MRLPGSQGLRFLPIGGICGLLVLALPGVGWAGSAANLQGIPLDFRCSASLPERHELLGSYPGEDLDALARALSEADAPSPKLGPHKKSRAGPSPTETSPPFGETDDPSGWLEAHLCRMAWSLFKASGAHRAAPDVQAPSRAVLSLELLRADLFSSRLVNQRMGPSVLPVSVPHWALAMHWRVSFGLEYPNDGFQTSPLHMDRKGGAEQEDYEALRLGALLVASVRAALGDLPQILADDGRLQDLLLPRLSSKPQPPQHWQASGPLANSFWLLLSPEGRIRHDALAFLLSGEVLPLETRIEMARWFLMNDSDFALRKDALAWLWREEDAARPEGPLDPAFRAILQWLLQREPSPRVRENAVQSLARRDYLDLRTLLLLAASDASKRVSEVALSALRSYPPATSQELSDLDETGTVPRLAPWTFQFSGRVLPPPADSEAQLLVLAGASPGAASEAWLQRWLQEAEHKGAALPQALERWRALASHPRAAIRQAALARLARERTNLDAVAILAERVRVELDPRVRLLAVDALSGEGGLAVKAALLQASEASESFVRAAAARALGFVPGAEAAARLEALAADDPGPKVRRQARKALRRR